MKRKATQFIRRGNEKFIHLDCKHCSWCRKDVQDTYDVMGIIMCPDCISRITRLSPKTGDIKVRIK